jgi:hypothetical protein
MADIYIKTENMKNKIFLIGILIISTYGFGQTTYSFDAKIKPEKKYSQKMVVNSSMQIGYTTDSIPLKNKKLGNESVTSVSKVLTTKKKDKNNYFEAIVEFGEISSTSNLKKALNPISNTIVKGNYIGKNLFKVQSVINEKIDDKTKELVKYSLENVKPEIEFPIKPLKIGDSFEHDMPMKIPVDQNNTVNLIIKKTYTLKEVNNNIAVFDLSELIFLDTNFKAENVLAYGNGTGIVEFNIAENQIVKNNSEFTIHMDLTEKLNVIRNIVSKSNSEIITTIE